MLPRKQKTKKRLANTNLRTSDVLKYFLVAIFFIATFFVYTNITIASQEVRLRGLLTPSSAEATAGRDNADKTSKSDIDSLRQSVFGESDKDTRYPMLQNSNVERSIPSVLKLKEIKEIILNLSFGFLNIEKSLGVSTGNSVNQVIAAYDRGAKTLSASVNQSVRVVSGMFKGAPTATEVVMEVVPLEDPATAAAAGGATSPSISGNPLSSVEIPYSRTLLTNLQSLPSNVLSAVISYGNFATIKANQMNAVIVAIPANFWQSYSDTEMAFRRGVLGAMLSVGDAYQGGADQFSGAVKGAVTGAVAIGEDISLSVENCFSEFGRGVIGGTKSIRRLALASYQNLNAAPTPSRLKAGNNNSAPGAPEEVRPPEVGPLSPEVVPPKVVSPSGSPQVTKIRNFRGVLLANLKSLPNDVLSSVVSYGTFLTAKANQMNAVIANLPAGFAQTFSDASGFGIEAVKTTYESAKSGIAALPKVAASSRLKAGNNINIIAQLQLAKSLPSDVLSAIISYGTFLTAKANQMNAVIANLPAGFSQTFSNIANFGTGAVKVTYQTVKLGIVKVTEVRPPQVVPLSPEVVPPQIKISENPLEISHSALSSWPKGGNPAWSYPQVLLANLRSLPSDVLSAILSYNSWLTGSAVKMNSVIVNLPAGFIQTFSNAANFGSSALVETQNFASLQFQNIKSVNIGEIASSAAKNVGQKIADAWNNTVNFGASELASLKCRLGVSSCPASTTLPIALQKSPSPPLQKGENIRENPPVISGNPTIAISGNPTIAISGNPTAGYLPLAPTPQDQSKLTPAITSPGKKPTPAAAAQIIGQPISAPSAKISEIQNLKLNGDLSVTGSSVFKGGVKSYGDFAVYPAASTLDAPAFLVQPSENKITINADIFAASSTATFGNIKVTGNVDFTGAKVTGLPVAQQTVNNYYGGGTTIVTAAGTGTNIAGQTGGVSQDFSVGRDLMVIEDFTISSAGTLTNNGPSTFKGPITVYAAITPSADATYSLGSAAARFANIYSQNLSVTSLSVGSTSSTGAQSIVASVPTGAVLNLQNTSETTSTARTLRMTDYGGSKSFDMWWDGTDMRMETSAGSDSDIYIHPDGGQVYLNTDLIVSGGNATVSSTGRANFAYDPATVGTPGMRLSSTEGYSDAKSYFVINPGDTVSFDRFLHFKQGTQDRLTIASTGATVIFPDNVVGLAIRASSTQTANLFEIQNSSGKQLTTIDASGYLGIGDGSVTSTITKNTLSSGATTGYNLGKFYVDSAGNVTASGTLNFPYGFTEPLYVGNGSVSTTINGTSTSTFPYGATFAGSGGYIYSTSRSGYTPNIQFSATGTMFATPTDAAGNSAFVLDTTGAVTTAKLLSVKNNGTAVLTVGPTTVAANSAVADGTYSAAFNGGEADGSYSFAANGAYTDAVAAYSFAANGASTYGTYSAAFNGGEADGSYSFAANGGYTTGVYAAAFGRNMTVSGANSFGVNLASTAQTLSVANTMAIMGGSVGIGNTAPTTKLTVSGGDFTVGSNSATTTVTGNTIASGIIDGYNLGKFYVDSAGNVTASGTLTFAGTATSTFGSRVFLPDGNAAYPALAFASDPDTGIYNSGANKLSFTALGSELFRIDGASGIFSYANIQSIGTTAFALTGRAYDGETAVGVISDTNPIFVTAGAKIHSFRTGSIEKAYIDYLGNLSIGNGTVTSTFAGASTSTFQYGATFATTGGNVGIGTASPAYLLDVAGSTRIYNPTSVTGNTKMYVQAGVADALGSGIFQLLNNAGSPKLKMDADANGAELTIGSQVRLNNGGIKFDNAGAVIWASGDFNTAADTGISRGGVNKLYVGNGTAGDFTGTLIAGNVGIGNTSPTTKLTVSGGDLTIGSNAATTTITGNTIASGIIEGYNLGKFYVSSDGNVSASGTILMPNGSVSAPSYSFNSLPTAGMYADSNVLRFAFGGVNTMQMDGTSVYANSLASQSGNALTLKGYITDGTSAVGVKTDTVYSFVTPGAKLLSIQNAATEKAYFDRNGDLSLVDGTYTSTLGMTTSTYLISHPASDTAGYSAFTLNTTSSLSNAALLTVRNNGTEKAYIAANGGIWSANNVYAANAFVSNTLTRQSAAVLDISGGPTDGPTAVGINLRSAESYTTSGAKLISIQNASVEKAYVDKDGYFVAPIFKDISNTFSLAYNYLSFGSAANIVWAPTTAYGGGDIGLNRNVAGLLKVTDGSTGFGDLVAGNLSVGNGTVTSTFAGGSTSTFQYGATFATTGGNVGIGTASPNAKLDIQTSAGDNILRFKNNGATGGDGTWTFSYDSAISGNLNLSSVWDNFKIYLDTNGDNITDTFSVYSSVAVGAGTPSFTVYNGNVGIGTAIPLSKFDVNGGVAIGSYAGVNAAPANGLIVSGNVGIGVTSSASPLTVTGGSGTIPALVVNPGGNAWSEGIRINPSSANSYNNISFTTTADSSTGSWGIGRNPSNQFYITNNTYSANGIPIMALTTAGNVGIGTTAPANKLSVSGGDFGVGDLGTTTTISGSSTSTFPYGATFATTGGNVGVGITNARAKLDVYGNIILGNPSDGGWNVTAEAGASGGGFFLNSYATLIGGLTNSAGGVVGLFTPNGGADINFMPNNTERMRILSSNGYVGIGTTGPSEKLTVIGNGAFGNGVTTTTISGTTTSTFANGIQLSSGCFKDVEGNCITASGTGANTALSNLSGVAINASLLPGTANFIDLGSYVKPWQNLFTSSTIFANAIQASGNTTLYGTLAINNTGTSTINGNISFASSGAYIDQTTTVGDLVNDLTIYAPDYISLTGGYGINVNTATGLTMQTGYLRAGTVWVSSGGYLGTNNGGTFTIGNAETPGNAATVNLNQANVTYNFSTLNIAGGITEPLRVGNGSVGTTIYGSSTSTFPYGATFASTGGNVGIGTATPGAALQVGAGTPLYNRGKLDVWQASRVVNDVANVNIYSNDSATINTGGSIGFGGANGSNSFVFGKIAGRLEAASGYAGYLQFSTTLSTSEVSEKMRITSTGYVGIATTTPNARLSVIGVNSNTVDAFVVASSTDGSPLLRVKAPNGDVAFGPNDGFLYEASSSISYINSIETTGGLNFPDDAGLVTRSDLTVTANSPANTSHGYIDALNGNPMLMFYGESDAAGGVNNLTVSIATSTTSTAKMLLDGGGAPGGAIKIVGGGIWADGTVGDTPTSGAGSGTRLMWIPSKAAFRAGQIGNDNWDAANIGVGSFAAGYGSKASGNYSGAIGNSNFATGHYSIALGNSNTASNYYSTAMGWGANASGLVATAMGYYTTASGSGSFAAGDNNLASGATSTAFGGNNTASGAYSTAMGLSTTANNTYSTAMGWHATASGFGSIAMGSYVTAQGTYSTAMGETVQATGDYSTAFGRSTLASGVFSTAMGWGTIASGRLSTALGNYSTASGSGALSMGTYVAATGASSTAIGSFASSTAANAITLGAGVDYEHPLVNNIANSLGIGFNSTTSTLWVGPASGGDTYGNVSIGGGSFYFDSTTGTTFIGSLETTGMHFPVNAGQVSWTDLAIDSGVLAGSLNSYTASINDNPVLTVWGEDDGTAAGTIGRYGLSIATSTTSTARMYIDSSSGSAPSIQFSATGTMFATPTDAAGNSAFVMDTTATEANAYLLSVRNNGTEKAYINKDGSYYTSGDLSSGNIYTYGIWGQSNSVLYLRGYSVNGATAVGVKIGNANTLSTAGAKILSLYNDNVTTEKAYFDIFGQLSWGDGSNTSTLGMVTSTYLYGHVPTDTAGYSAFTLNTTGTISNANLLSIRNNGTEKVSITAAGGITASGNIYTTGAFLATSIQPMAAGSFTVQGIPQNGATAVGVILNSAYETLITDGAKLISIRNYGVEKAYFDKDGQLTIVGDGNATTTISSNLATSTIASGLIVNNGSFENNSSSTVTFISSFETPGGLNFPDDAGYVSWTNMNITTSTPGIGNSFAAGFNSDTLFQLYAASDGAGGYTNQTISMGTSTTSTYMLFISSSDSASTTAVLGVQGYVKATGFIASSSTLDIAETYPVAADCEVNGTCPTAGDVVCLSDDGGLSSRGGESSPSPSGVSGQVSIVKCTSTSTDSILGVISDNPGLVLGGYDVEAIDKGLYPSTYKPVALSGRVDVRVSTANGPIKPGDLLTSSGVPGVAVKAIDPGRVIGVALQSLGDATSPSCPPLSPEVGSPQVGQPSGVNGQSSGVGCQVSGVIKVFINPHWSPGAFAEGDISNDDFPDFSLQGLLDNFTLVVKNSLRKLGLLVQNGIAKVKEIYAEKIHTDLLCVGQTCVTEEQLKELLQKSGVSSDANVGGDSAQSPSAPITEVVPPEGGATSPSSPTQPEVVPPIVTEPPTDNSAPSGAPTSPSEPDASPEVGSPQVEENAPAEVSPPQVVPPVEPPPSEPPPTQ